MNLKKVVITTIVLIILALLFRAVVIDVNEINKNNYLEEASKDNPKDEVVSLKESESNSLSLIETNNSEEQTTEDDVSNEANVSEESEEEPYYSSDVELLAHLIYAEANVFYNSDTEEYEYCSDLWQCYVGCVALNRVDSSLFPSTLKEVIYEEGQYACTWDDGFQRTPDERSYENAIKLLDGYRPLPCNVVFQAQFEQGNGIYEKIGNTYFCYY